MTSTILTVFLCNSEVWMLLTLLEPSPVPITLIQLHLVLGAQVNAVCAIRTSSPHLDVISVTPEHHWELLELPQVIEAPTDVCVCLAARRCLGCSS